MNKLPLFQKGHSGGIKFGREINHNPRIYLFLFITCIIVLFLLLIIRLIQLTIVKGDYYKRLSETNRIRELLIEPKRGTILDRKGLIVAQNSPSDIKSQQTRIRSNRTYQTPEAIASLIGYQSLADSSNLREDSCINKLQLGDKVGKKGVEKVYDCNLRGRLGKKLIEVDARGIYLKTLTLLPPVDGQTLQLGLDLQLQKKAYELIKDKRGAVVVLKPKTGEILTLVSSPTFNPQDFEDSNQQKIAGYFSDEKKPLFNRAIEATYPPGSLFKLTLATGALEEKKIDEKFTIEDTGIITAGPLKFGNWYFLQYGKTDGMVDIVKAIRRSNDIFFYKTGELLGPEKIKIWAQNLGYGKKTGVPLDEDEGMIPSPFWKEETLHDHWYLGDTYNLSIGQGYLLVTPLQVTQVTSIFANDGVLCKPQLLKMYGENVVGNADLRSLPNCKKLPISQKTIEFIREGMKEACSPGGTGWPLFNFAVKSNTSEVKEELVKIQTACKTGTAESRSKNTPPHAWITVFAPFENPEIALTVLIEEGGQGSDVAGPIAKEILKAYFERLQ